MTVAYKLNTHFRAISNVVTAVMAKADAASTAMVHSPVARECAVTAADRPVAHRSRDMCRTKYRRNDSTLNPKGSFRSMFSMGGAVPRKSGGSRLLANPASG